MSRWATQRYVNKRLNQLVEDRYGTITSNLTLPTTPSIIDFTILSSAQINGIMILPKFIDIGFYAHAPGADDAGHVMRYVIFRWIPQNDSATPIPDPTTILLDSTAGRAVVSPFSPVFKESYEILYDKIITIASNHPIRVYERLLFSPNKPITYNYGVVTDGTIGSNKLFIMKVSDTTGVTFSETSMLTYTDA